MALIAGHYLNELVKQIKLLTKKKLRNYSEDFNLKFTMNLSKFLGWSKKEIIQDFKLVLVEFCYEEKDSMQKSQVE